MENLWPVDLINPLSKVDSGWEVFEAQAIAINQTSMGLIQGEVRHREMPVGRSSSLFLYPSAQPAKGYEFMAIRSAGGDFPLALEVYHLGESKRIWQARDSQEVKRVLRKIFANEATLRVIRSLAQESTRIQSNESAEEHDPLPKDAAPGQNGGEEPPSIASTSESTRPIAVGGLILESGVRFATVNLLGVSGFMSIDELNRLAAKPDSRGAAINTWNGRYVVDISFLDNVRMTLSADELKVLQSEVRRSLSCAC